MSEGIIIGPASAADIDSYLKANKPSAKISSNGRGGWYWAYSGSERKVETPRDEDTFYKEGAVLKKALEDECVRIKAEEPVRENKKQGRKSQKQCRDIAYEVFNAGVEELSKRCGILSGKWLFMPRDEQVDNTWKKLVYAMSGESGALGKHPKCNTAKIAVAPEDGGDSWACCVYVDDSWDRPAVGEVFEILVKEVGLVPISYKCDANTLLDISSKHVSGIRPSLYTASEFMSKDEIAAFFAAKKVEDDKGKPGVKERTEEDEVKDLGGGFEDAESDSEEETKKPMKKKVKS